VYVCSITPLKANFMHVDDRLVGQEVKPNWNKGYNA
jgi:hypothetical protein